VETTVPFKPTQGRPVLCRQCFQSKRAPTTGSLVTAATTVELVAGGPIAERSTELMVVAAQSLRG
jgi:hypothetical protein